MVYEVLGKAICSRTNISTQLAEYEGFPQRLLFTITLCFGNCSGILSFAIW